MSHTRLIFTVFPLLVGTLVFAIWSNSYVFAQQLSSSPSSSPAASSSSSLSSTTISPELKAKMCDPSNPSLKVVNTTESTICGIPKTVKPPSLSAAMPPPTSAVSSSSPPPPQQTTTTKPTTTSNDTAISISTGGAFPKQQQITTTSNNTAISQSTGGATGATIVIVSNSSNASLSSPPTIAPQVNAISQQQPQPVTAINGTAAINSTAGQNYPFATTTQAVASGKLMYLGYHSDDGTPITDSDSSPKDKSSSSDTKPSTDHSSSASTHSTSTEKKTSTTKSDSDSSPKDKSSSSDTKPSTDHSKSNTTTTDNGSTDNGSIDTKSPTHDNGGSKQSSKTSSQSKDHKDHESNESNKAKNESTPKGDKNHNDGDRFFGGDPFFSDNDGF